MEEERLMQVEMKISFLEATVEELNGIVIAQRKEIAMMEQKIEKLTQKVEDLIEENGDGARPNRRPPHY